MRITSDRNPSHDRGKYRAFVVTDGRVAVEVYLTPADQESKALEVGTYLIETERRIIAGRDA